MTQYWVLAIARDAQGKLFYDALQNGFVDFLREMAIFYFRSLGFCFKSVDEKRNSSTVDMYPRHLNVVEQAEKPGSQDAQLFGYTWVSTFSYTIYSTCLCVFE